MVLAGVFSMAAFMILTALSFLPTQLPLIELPLPEAEVRHQLAEISRYETLLFGVPV